MICAVPRESIIGVNIAGGWKRFYGSLFFVCHQTFPFVLHLILNAYIFVFKRSHCRVIIERFLPLLLLL